jgi:RNA polymerase sigma factor (TIGR02999 family)
VTQPPDHDECIDLHDAFERLYQDLRKLAELMLREERPDLTLTATALANEVFLRLSSPKKPKTWKNDPHFFADVSRSFKRILIDHARGKNAQKRGGAWNRLGAEVLDDLPDMALQPLEYFGILEGPLQRLKAAEPELVALVKRRVSDGQTCKEIAEATGESLRTIEAQWYAARLYLGKYLAQDGFVFPPRPRKRS